MRQVPLGVWKTARSLGALFRIVQTGLERCHRRPYLALECLKRCHNGAARCLCCLWHWLDLVRTPAEAVTLHETHALLPLTARTALTAATWHHGDSRFAIHGCTDCMDCLHQPSRQARIKDFRGRHRWPAVHPSALAGQWPRAHAACYDEKGAARRRQRPAVTSSLCLCASA